MIPQVAQVTVYLPSLVEVAFLSIVIVFRVIPYWIGLLVIPVILLFMDRDALKKVDYPLLLTFVFFFILDFASSTFSIASCNAFCGYSSSSPMA